MERPCPAPAAQRGGEAHSGAPPRLAGRPSPRGPVAGPCGVAELEVGELVVLRLVGLVGGQAQGLVFVWETPEHAQVYEAVVTDVDLDEVVGPCDHLALERHGLKDVELAIFLLFQLGFHLGRERGEGSAAPSVGLPAREWTRPLPARSAPGGTGRLSLTAAEATALLTADSRPRSLSHSPRTPPSMLF